MHKCKNGNNHPPQRAARQLLKATSKKSELAQFRFSEYMDKLHVARAPVEKVKRSVEVEDILLKAADEIRDLRSTRRNPDHHATKVTILLKIPQVVPVSAQMNKK